MASKVAETQVRDHSYFKDNSPAFQVPGYTPGDLESTDKLYKGGVNGAGFGGGGGKFHGVGGKLNS